jgi:hypothetical protein
VTNAVKQVFTPVSAARTPGLQLRVSSETDALIQYKAALARQTQLVDMVRPYFCFRSLLVSSYKILRLDVLI